jgi:prophage regulatory protein
MTDTNQHQTPTTQTRLIRWPKVEGRVGICRSHAHTLIQKGQFPAPIKLGGENARASGWLESDIDQWIEDRVAESRKAKEAS